MSLEEYAIWIPVVLVGIIWVICSIKIAGKSITKILKNIPKDHRW